MRGVLVAEQFGALVSGSLKGEGEVRCDFDGRLGSRKRVIRSRDELRTRIFLIPTFAEGHTQ